MTEHTPGPLVVGRRDTDGWEDGESTILIDAKTNSAYFLASVFWLGADKVEEQIANARRLVAAWNACLGISTEALEDGIIADLIRNLETSTKFIEIESGKVRDDVRELIEESTAILIKAKGES